MFQLSRDEIYELAEDLERNGVRFYTQAAARVGEEGLARLLTELARMEEGHYRRLHALRTPEATEKADGESELSLYLQAMADLRVFPVDARMLALFLAQATPVDILEYALTCEKETIIVFLTLKELLPAPQGDFDGLIREELEHIRLLRYELGRLVC
jgi:rubrerythrin